LIIAKKREWCREWQLERDEEESNPKALTQSVRQGIIFGFSG
jgi:hypothetical protein